MAKISFVNATQEYIDALKGRLRESDEKACWSTSHLTADEGLQQAFEGSVLCWVALADGVPVFCCGVNRRAMLSVKGIPWLFATNDICKLSFRIVRHSRGLIKYMLTRFDILETWVDVRNKVSVAWLKWCGFNMDKAEPVGLDKKLFRKCWLEKGVT